MSDNPEIPDVVKLAQQFKNAIIRRDVVALNRLTHAYQALYLRVKDKIELLVNKIELAGGTMTPGQVQKLAQWDDLMRSIEREMADYTAFMRVELSQDARLMIGQATRDARMMLGSALGGESALIARIQTLNPRVIESLLGFLDPEGPLYARLSLYPGAAVERVAQTILESIGMGKNPRVLAGLIRDDLGGSLTDALRTARTVQLWSYREASRANYAANSDLVTGWIWWASLDDATCPACIMMHGTRHDMSETLDDHYNGRCSMIPVTILNPDPGIETGEEWFMKQDEAKQKTILGSEYFAAWKDGAYQLNQLPHQREEEVYGSMRGVSSLASLLGEQ